MIELHIYDLHSLHCKDAAAKRRLRDEVARLSPPCLRVKYATTIEVHGSWANNENSDNLIKPILDAIQAASGVNDAWFDWELHFYKREASGAPWARVTMHPI